MKNITVAYTNPGISGAIQCNYFNVPFKAFELIIDYLKPKAVNKLSANKNCNLVIMFHNSKILRKYNNVTLDEYEFIAEYLEYYFINLPESIANKSWVFYDEQMDYLNKLKLAVSK